MLKHLRISSSEVFQRLKISCKLPLLVKEVAHHQIIHDTAVAKGITVTDLELQQAADNFRIKYNLHDPASTWEWLKQNHLTGEDFEQSISESIIMSKLIQQLFGDRVEPYFYEHQLDFTRVALYEIVFDDFDTAIEQFYALQEGEIAFAEVARRYIEEPELRYRHGYLGVRSRLSLNSAISAAVFDSQPPQILKPIVIGKKAHLILVEEIIEPVLDESLRNEILHQLFSAWLEQQLQSYKLEVE